MSAPVWKCAICDHPDDDHAESGCAHLSGCACIWTGSARECTCTHAYLRVHSGEGCAYRSCPCTFTEGAP